MLKLVFILKRIVILSKAHATRFKPAIQNFFNPLVVFAVFGESNLVYKWPVQIVHLDVITRQLLEFFNARYYDVIRFISFINPDWQRSTPIAVTANRPIT